ncbi:MAG: PadR family transcriptional regulator [Promethearchaeota archaeon]|jgi:DNA-binding PadR family transcriptional regulator
MTSFEEKIAKISINHSEFIILGLISEEREGDHAYSINKKIKDRGMRSWTNIGRSSVYRVIRNLEEKGLAITWIEEIDNRSINKFKLTDQGIEVLKAKVFNVIKEFVGRDDKDFYVAFSMLPILSTEQLIKGFSNSINLMKKHKKELEEMLEENSKTPLNVRGLFIHPIKILQTDIEFLEMVLDEIRRGGGKVDPEAYNK